MNEKQDTTTLGIRFGCGSLLGIVSGLSFAMHTFEPSTRNTIIACVVFMVLFGALAVRYGDRFWERISSYISWW
jgi:hypothetical protein